jgi:hypothetical protein
MPPSGHTPPRSPVPAQNALSQSVSGLNSAKIRAVNRKYWAFVRKIKRRAGRGFTSLSNHDTPSYDEEKRVIRLKHHEAILVYRTHALEQ